MPYDPNTDPDFMPGGELYDPNAPPQPGNQPAPMVNGEPHVTQDIGQRLPQPAPAPAAPAAPAPPSYQLPPKSDYQLFLENAQKQNLQQQQRRTLNQPPNTGGLDETVGYLVHHPVPGTQQKIFNEQTKNFDDYGKSTNDALRDEIVQRGQDLRLQGQSLTSGNRSNSQAAMLANRLSLQISDRGQNAAFNREIAALGPNPTSMQVMQVASRGLAEGRWQSNTLPNELKMAQRDLAVAHIGMVPHQIGALDAAAANNNANTTTTLRNLQTHEAAPADLGNHYASGGIVSRVLDTLNPIGTAEAAAPQQNTHDQGAQTQQQTATPTNASVRQALNDLEKDAIRLHMKSAYGPEQNSTFTGNYASTHEGAPGIIGEAINGARQVIPYLAGKLQTDAPDSAFNLAARQDMDTKAKAVTLANIKNQVGGRITNLEMGLAGQGQGFVDQPYSNVTDNIDRFRYILDRSEARLNTFNQAKRANPNLDLGSFESQWENANPVDSHSGKVPQGYTPFPTFDQYRATQDARRAPDITTPPHPGQDNSAINSGQAGAIDRATMGLARYAFPGTGDDIMNQAREQHPDAFSTGQTVGNIVGVPGQAAGAGLRALHIPQVITGAANYLRRFGNQGTPGTPPGTPPPPDINPPTGGRVEPTFDAPPAQVQPSAVGNGSVVTTPPPVGSGMRTDISEFQRPSMPETPAAPPEAPAAPAPAAPPNATQIDLARKVPGTKPQDWVRKPDGTWGLNRPPTPQGYTPPPEPTPENPVTATMQPEPPEGFAQAVKPRISVPMASSPAPDQPNIPGLARGGRVATPPVPGPGARLAMLRTPVPTVGAPSATDPLPPLPKGQPYASPQFYGDQSTGHSYGQPTKFYAQGGDIRNGQVINAGDNYASGGAVNGRAHKMQLRSGLRTNGLGGPLRGGPSNGSPIMNQIPMPTPPMGYNSGGHVGGAGGHAHDGMPGLMSLGTTLTPEGIIGSPPASDTEDFAAYRDGSGIGRDMNMPPMPNGLVTDRNQSTPASPFDDYAPGYAKGGAIPGLLNQPGSVVNPGLPRGTMATQKTQDSALPVFKAALRNQRPGVMPMPTTHPTAYPGQIPVGPVPNSMATGGQIPPWMGKPGVIDSVPARTATGQPLRVNAGEFVVKKSSTDQLGNPALNTINNFDHLPPDVQRMIQQELQRAGHRA